MFIAEKDRIKDKQKYFKIEIYQPNITFVFDSHNYVKANR